ncbi:MAG: hypothetical protein P4L40_06110 [Terracidiphilus sp.]|nr:hypothetical protein [Terracidiphilus sp.]
MFFAIAKGEPVPIVVSQFGDHIGVIGSVMMAKERLEEVSVRSC